MDEKEKQFYRRMRWINTIIGLLAIVVAVIAILLK